MLCNSFPAPYLVLTGLRRVWSPKSMSWRRQHAKPKAKARAKPEGPPPDGWGFPAGFVDINPRGPAGPRQTSRIGTWWPFGTDFVWPVAVMESQKLKCVEALTPTDVASLVSLFTTSWWFQILFIFIPTWGRFPF